MVNFLSNTSLLAKFMNAKFYLEVHPNMIYVDKGLEVWRMMTKVHHLAEQHIGWIVHSENSNF